jgi:hypothetical protein
MRPNEIRDENSIPFGSIINLRHNFSVYKEEIFVRILALGLALHTGIGLLSFM